ncbi:MAG: hemerythrin domain-containing protein [Burkholderiaceae bacterium]|nr:hemerythrin domain-containing protein [Burkholderiaceae bacterium]
MSRIRAYMSADHRRCDAHFVAAEEAVLAGDWEAAGAAFRRYGDALDAHLAMEEEVLFPAFEEETGMTGGPTAMMRAEHRELRSLVRRVQDALTHREVEAWLGSSEMLRILAQQHDLKEEGVLYPMMDRALAGRQDELLPQIASLAAEAADA